LYRAVAWKVEKSGIDKEDSDAIRQLLDETEIDVHLGHESTATVMVDSQQLGAELRSPEITKLASAVAALPVVREWLLPIQQHLGERGGLVAEGRDMGTRVFPHADLKFFLDANLETRANRRHQEHQATGETSDARAIQAQIADRDERDRSRELAPLKPAEGAVVIDSTALTVDDVVETMMERIFARQ
jgi:cytidylate kinase